MASHKLLLRASNSILPEDREYCQEFAVRQFLSCRGIYGIGKLMEIGKYISYVLTTLLIPLFAIYFLVVTGQGFLILLVACLFGFILRQLFSQTRVLLLGSLLGISMGIIYGIGWAWWAFKEAGIGPCKVFCSSSEIIPMSVAFTLGVVLFGILGIYIGIYFRQKRLINKNKG